MLGKYFPTELYPQPLYALDYIQHLIDKDQRKETLLSLTLVIQGCSSFILLYHFCGLQDSLSSFSPLPLHWLLSCCYNKTS